MKHSTLSVSQKQSRFLPYHVVPFGSIWALYRWHDSSKTRASKVSKHVAKGEAVNEAYRLNGEYFKQQKL